MKLIESTFDLCPDLSVFDIPAENKALFFDIETTGFVAARTSLYIIGCVFKQNNNWLYRQWFLENHNEEPDVLREFSEFLSNFDTIIHFNGATFDIPYMSQKYARYKQPSPFAELNSIDIYKCIAPCKKLLSLNSLKQKACEEFLGLFREDIFSGGDLIELYKVYAETFDKKLLEVLLLHNREDLSGMLSILPMLNYPKLFSVSPAFKKHSVCSYTSMDGSNSEELFLEFVYPFEIPVSFKYCAEHNILMSFEGSSLKMRIPIHSAELKFFYPNYKDYYYLPVEDCAMHKSVSQFVDKAFRQKATAANCYSKKSGNFIPFNAKSVKKDFEYRIFREEYNSATAFLELPGNNSSVDCNEFYTAYLSLITENL